MRACNDLLSTCYLCDWQMTRLKRATNWAVKLATSASVCLVQSFPINSIRWARDDVATALQGQLWTWPHYEEVLRTIPSVAQRPTRAHSRATSHGRFSQWGKGKRGNTSNLIVIHSLTQKLTRVMLHMLEGNTALGITRRKILNEAMKAANAAGHGIRRVQQAPPFRVAEPSICFREVQCCQNEAALPRQAHWAMYTGLPG